MNNNNIFEPLHKIGNDVFKIIIDYLSPGNKFYLVGLHCGIKEILDTLKEELTNHFDSKIIDTQPDITNFATTYLNFITSYDELSWQFVDSLLHFVLCQTNINYLKWFNDMEIFNYKNYKKYTEDIFTERKADKMTFNKYYMYALGKVDVPGEKSWIRLAYNMHDEQMLLKYDATNVDVNDVIKYGHMNVLKFLVEKKGFRCYNDMAMFAVRYGHLEILKYIQSNGVILFDFLLLEAIVYEHLEIIKYLIKIGIGIGIGTKRNIETLINLTVRAQNNKIFDYFLANKLFDIKMVMDLLNTPESSESLRLSESLIADIASGKDRDITINKSFIKMLMKNGFKPSKNMLSTALQKGNFAFLNSVVEYDVSYKLKINEFTIWHGYQHDLIADNVVKINRVSLNNLCKYLYLGCKLIICQKNAMKELIKNDNFMRTYIDTNNEINVDYIIGLIDDHNEVLIEYLFVELEYLPSIFDVKKMLRKAVAHQYIFNIIWDKCEKAIKSNKYDKDAINFNALFLSKDRNKDMSGNKKRKICP